jgi:hypothetical protein
MHWAFPRDLVVFIWPGWFFLTIWCGTQPRRDPYSQIGAAVIARWLGYPQRRERLGRWRNGKTAAWATVAAISATVLIYSTKYDAWRIGTVRGW